MNVLTNLPLDSFDPLAAFGERIVSFGQSDRLSVDVDFDAGRQDVAELFSALPIGFAPDVLLLWWPDQFPVPLGLESCPVPIVGILSDYNLTLPWTLGLWPFFDTLLVDRPGAELFAAAGFPDVRPFCQFSFQWDRDQLRQPLERRNTDVAFAGNVHPVVQADRASWLDRLRALQRHGDTPLDIAIHSALRGTAYSALLNGAKIGFNRSVRGEMNLRGFEVPANGGLLMMERENLEVRDFFEPGHEVVLYGDEDFEELVRYYAHHDAERIRIARAGHARVQNYRMSRRLPELLRTALAPAPRGRTRRASRFERALGRAHALVPATTPNYNAFTDARTAIAERPDDPRGWNALAVAAAASGATDGKRQALAWFERAMRLRPTYGPTMANLARLFVNSEGGRTLRAAAIERFNDPTAPIEDLDGAQLPTDFDELHLHQSFALRRHLTQPCAVAMSAASPASGGRSAATARQRSTASSSD